MRKSVIMVRRGDDMDLDAWFAIGKQPRRDPKMIITIEGLLSATEINYQL